MIKKFEQFNESLKDKLVGPTEHEVVENFKKLPPDEMLKRSSKLGLIDGVKIAIERGADINYIDCLALKYACDNGYYDIAKYLIDNGANIRPENKSHNLLTLASEKGYNDILGLLINKGLSVHINYDEPLIKSIKGGHLETVKFLLKRGCNIHTMNDTPIINACFYGHTDIVNFLLDKGVDINVDNGYPLRVSVENNHLDTTKLLLDRGVIIYDETKLLKSSIKNRELFSLIKKYIKYDD